VTDRFAGVMHLGSMEVEMVVLDRRSWRYCQVIRFQMEVLWFVEITTFRQHLLFSQRPGLDQNNALQ